MQIILIISFYYYNISNNFLLFHNIIEMYLRWTVDQSYFNNNIAQIYKLISNEKELCLKVIFIAIVHTLQPHINNFIYISFLIGI